jgi:hypothetical protein
MDRGVPRSSPPALTQHVHQRMPRAHRSNTSSSSEGVALCDMGGTLHGSAPVIRTLVFETVARCIQVPSVSGHSEGQRVHDTNAVSVCRLQPNSALQTGHGSLVETLSHAGRADGARSSNEVRGGRSVRLLAMACRRRCRARARHPTHGAPMRTSFSRLLTAAPSATAAAYGPAMRTFRQPQ